MAYESKIKTQVEAIVDSVALKALARVSLALAIPFSFWGLNKLAEMHDAVITLQTQMVQAQGDKYTGTDARKDGKAYLSLIARNQADIAELAKRQADDEIFLYRNSIKRRYP